MFDSWYLKYTQLNFQFIKTNSEGNILISEGKIVSKNFKSIYDINSFFYLLSDINTNEEKAFEAINLDEQKLICDIFIKLDSDFFEIIIIDKTSYYKLVKENVQEKNSVFLKNEYDNKELKHLQKINYLKKNIQNEIESKIKNNVHFTLNVFDFFISKHQISDSNSQLITKNLHEIIRLYDLDLMINSYQKNEEKFSILDLEDEINTTLNYDLKFNDFKVKLNFEPSSHYIFIGNSKLINSIILTLLFYFNKKEFSKTLKINFSAEKNNNIEYLICDFNINEGLDLNKDNSFDVYLLSVLIELYNLKIDNSKENLNILFPVEKRKKIYYKTKKVLPANFNKLKFEVISLNEDDTLILYNIITSLGNSNFSNYQNFELLENAKDKIFILFIDEFLLLENSKSIYEKTALLENVIIIQNKEKELNANTSKYTYLKKPFSKNKFIERVKIALK